MSKNQGSSVQKNQERAQRHTKDRRVMRTRKLLLDSLMELMLEKGYEHITVQNIIDHANVGRSTFYAHFLDKQDLLQSGIDHLKEFLIQQQEIAVRQVPGTQAHYKFRISFSLAMFEHAQDHYHLYRAMAGKESGALVQHHMKLMFLELMQKEMSTLSSSKGISTIPVDILIQYTVSSLMSMMTWWLDQDIPYTAEKMDEIFHNLTTPGLVAVLNAGEL
jgi:AcrR family transcriptional regulator